jgi:hypothetical protein
VGYINRSQKHECRNWDCGRAVSFLGIFFSNFRYFVFAVWLKSKELAPAKLSRESQPMVYREGTIVYRKVDSIQLGPPSKYVKFDVYSMSKSGGRRKLSKTMGQLWQVEIVKLLRTFSSTCFVVKIVCNYRHWIWILREGFSTHRFLACPL